jgi:hypothetical protein
LPVLPAEAREFLALGGGHHVRPRAVLGIGAAHPAGDRGSTRLELARQLLGRAAGADEIDHLAPKLRRISRAIAGHQEHLRLNSQGVRESGSTPKYLINSRYASG